MGSRATCMLVVNDIDSGLCVMKKKTQKGNQSWKLPINIEAKILAIVLKVSKSKRRL